MSTIRNSHGERLDVAMHDAEKSDCLVIIGHGVTGNKDRPMLVELADALAEAGWPCLRISYSGNGESEGSFSDSTISKEVADLSAVIDQVGSGKRIAFIGHSMSGAVAALFAARDERVKVMVSLAGMVHTAAFHDREFGDVTPGEGYMWDDEDCPLSQTFLDDMQQIGSTLDAARDLRTPWLLLHGSDDDVVPVSDSHDLKEVLRGPVRLLEIQGTGHMFDGNYSVLACEVSDWLEKHL
ncbi:alpha/beta fold hydrolase [Verrucomicrobiaceae bacterium 5K15]|uniref:Alpha/beta fold hydrolase n=1 Tax=Oceaniferula flava TaxID=2800421 RepID=A0AAE2SES7_9BACT|nr:alpha/beta fold hydrolase [Oceaniferula flavus]MBK1855662.1 alpha/beta fold hydrolase [Oceaniferula flavus]MBM1136968.1 alpha/beta fold hydrolase [Oceaniferula flavus]